MKKTFTLLLVSLVFALSANATIYVKKNAVGANNGTSWADAYTSLVSALADPNHATDEIWVAAGSYLSASYTQPFNIQNGSKVYGGFNGTETLLTQRDPSANLTILTGDQLITNNYHVVTFLETDGWTVLDGFTIQKGYANLNGETDNGGGIYVRATTGDCFPEIWNCIIKDNYCDNQGGGVYVYASDGYTCNPFFKNCSFLDNISNNYGGAVYIWGQGGEASPLFEQCTFESNISNVYGGAVAFEASLTNGICQAQFNACLITNNESDTGGGFSFTGWDDGDCSPTITNCTFYGNSGLSEGGVMDYWSDDGGGICNPSFKNCIMWGNSSILMNFDGSDPTIDYSYSDVEGSGGSDSWDVTLGIDMGSNIDSYPYYNNALSGDYRTHYASLTVGGGDAAGAPTEDLDGNPYSNPPSMGAYEYAALPGDWDGATDSDWNTPSNWLTGVVATASDDVYLSSTATNFPIVNEAPATPAVCNNLQLLEGTELTVNPGKALTVYGDLDIDNAALFTLLSNSSGAVGTILTEGNILGEMDIQRDMSDGEWHLISIPVNSIQVDLFYGDFMQTYNEATAEWTDIVDETTILEPMVGYALWGEVPLRNTTYTFTGEPGNGVQTIGVTALNPNGWNLLGNPYPSSIDWEMVVTDPNINNAVYYLDATDGQYKSYIDYAGDGSQYIPPMQGFWISADAAANFSLDNTVRTHDGSSLYYKNQEALPVSVILSVKKGEMIDKTFVRFREEATSGFDGKFDAYKLFGPNTNYPQLYSLAGDTKLSVNQLPATELIDLGFKSGISGTYAVQLDELNDVTSCVLEDLKTGQMSDLSKGMYTFEYTAGENDNRFRIHLSVTSVDQAIARENIRIYSKDKKVFVTSDQIIVNGTLTINDLSGRTLLETSVDNETFMSLNTNLLTGVYVVSLKSETGVVTKKVILN